MPKDRTEYYKLYYQEHKTKMNEYSKQYRAAHPDVDKRYKERHKDDIVEKSRLYYIRTKLGNDTNNMKRRPKNKTPILEAGVETPKIKKSKKTPIEKRRDAIAKDLAVIQKRADAFKMSLNNIANADKSAESSGNESNQ
jgi:hypothetical protein